MNTTAQNADDYIAEQKNKLAKNPQCANTRYNLGVAYLSKRMWHEAEREFRQAVQDSPKMAEAYVQLGGICMHRGDLDGCMSLNKMAKEIRPAFAVPFANIGFCLLQQGKVEDAIASLRKAVGRDPTFVQAWSTLGSAFYMQNDLDEAEKALAKALELEPRFGPAYNNLALVWLDRGDKAKALENVELARKWGYEVDPKLVEQIEAL